MNSMKAQVAVPRPDLNLDSLWNDSALWIADNTGRIVIALLIGGIVAALLLAAKWAGARLARHYSAHNHWRRIIGQALAKIRLWFVFAAAAQLVATFAHAPDDLAHTVYFLFVIAATLQGAVFAREIVLGLVEYRAAAEDAHAGLASALGIIRLLVTFILFALATVLILSNLGVNVTGLIAGLGVGGIAIGLAAQGIFADLFAALAIIFDRPFRRGDWIRWDTTRARVELVGLKSTRLRSVDGEEVIIANKNLLDKELHNYTQLERQRVRQKIGITYETPAEARRRLPEIARAIVEAQPLCIFVRCALEAFGDSSLDFLLLYDVSTVDGGKLADARHAINMALLDRFAEAGIAFAYPVQVGYAAAPDGTLIMPYPEATA